MQIYLPRAAAAAPAEAASGHADPAPLSSGLERAGAPAGADGAAGMDASAPDGATVLFVEDDALVREAVVQALRAAGFTVRIAVDGEDALAQLERDATVDVVFSDIVMPGSVSGIDLAGIVKARWPALPIVLATGYTERRVALPDVKILAKPYDIEQLLGLLGHLAGRR